MTKEEYEKKVIKAREYAKRQRERQLEKINSEEYRQKQIEKKIASLEKHKARALSKPKKTIKKKQYTAKKTKGKYHSIFSEDMNVCYITGASEGVVPHHIFSGSDKAFSEKYGFILPLRWDWHTQSPYSIHVDKELDLKYKKLCEEYWCNDLNKDKDEWLKECSSWY